ncbi:hypothetical protein ACKWTF_001319 [Chironomus riparius]
MCLLKHQSDKMQPISLNAVNHNKNSHHVDVTVVFHLLNDILTSLLYCSQPSSTRKCALTHFRLKIKHHRTSPYFKETVNGNSKKKTFLNSHSMIPTLLVGSGCSRILE